MSLKFLKTGIKTSCSCPLDEPWCKHVVALGLSAIKDHHVDELMYEKFDIPPVFFDEDNPMTENPKGGYIFHFNPKRRQNFFSILVMDRNTKRVMRDLEGIFKAVLEEQKNNPDFKLNEVQKLEAMMFSMLLKQSRLDKKSGWYDVQINKFDEFFKMLSKMEDVIDSKTHKKILFTADIWKLCLAINIS